MLARVIPMKIYEIIFLGVMAFVALSIKSFLDDGKPIGNDVPVVSPIVFSVADYSNRR